jgi:hypothetical protein
VIENVVSAQSSVLHDIAWQLEAAKARFAEYVGHDVGKL